MRRGVMVLGGLLIVGVIVVGSLLYGEAPPAGAQEADQAPWEGYDPGPPPRDADGELYHGSGESSSSWEEDGGCQHRYYSHGTPYWDCQARGRCDQIDFYSVNEEGRFVSLDEDDRPKPAFVVCDDRNGPFTGDDFLVLKPAEDEDDEDTYEHNDDFDPGKRYIVCTNRAEMYSTDWMHCPPYGFRTVPCMESNGFGFELDVPVAGETQVGEENSGFWDALNNYFQDRLEARIVPDSEGPPGGGGSRLQSSLDHAQQKYGDDLTWWYDEIAGETLTEAGDACLLAETPPTFRTCDEIVEDRDHAQQMLDDPPTYGDERDRGVARSTARAYWEEQVRDLESQGSIIPDTCFGTFPTEAYRIFYETNGVTGVSDWPSWFMGTLGDLAFTLLKALVAGSLWMVRAALTLDVGEYRDMVSELSGRWDVQLIHFGNGSTVLIDFAWFALFGVAAVLVLRGKAVRGAGEIAGSMVMAALGGVLMAGAFTSGGYFESMLDLVDTTSRSMLLAGSGCDANDRIDAREVEQLIAGRYDCGRDGAATAEQGGLGGVVHREFVETPFRYVNWGTDELSEPCQVAEERLLRLTGMNTTFATRFMERQGCVDEAHHSNAMSIGRLTSVLVVVVVGVFVSVLLLGIAFALFMAKFVVAILFVLLPFFVVAAILPGGARRPALWGAENMLKVWLVAWIMGFLLAGGLVGFQAIAKVTEGRSLFERQVVFAVLLATLWSCYKQADRGGQAMAGALGGKLGQVLSPSASWASVGAGAGGGGGGIPIARMSGGGNVSGAAAWITAAGTASTALMTAGRGAFLAAAFAPRGVGRFTKLRLGERRVANRGSKNLINKEVLAANLPVGTPGKSGGLARAVRRVQNQHGPGYVLPKPTNPATANGAGRAPDPGRLAHPNRHANPRGPAPVAAVQRIGGRSPAARNRLGLGPQQPRPAGTTGHSPSTATGRAAGWNRPAPAAPSQTSPERSGWWERYHASAAQPPPPTQPEAPRTAGLLGRLTGPTRRERRHQDRAAGSEPSRVGAWMAGLSSQRLDRAVGRSNARWRRRVGPSDTERLARERATTEPPAARRRRGRREPIPEPTGEVTPDVLQRRLDIYRRTGRFPDE